MRIVILSWLSLVSATVLADGSMADEGQALYSQTCIACHGANGKGTIPGVRDFTAPDGPLSKSDDELVKSISDGVATPGAALTMPAKGGNPALTETQILSLIAYLRAEFSS